MIEFCRRTRRSSRQFYLLSVISGMLLVLFWSSVFSGLPSESSSSKKDTNIANGIEPACISFLNVTAKQEFYPLDFFQNNKGKPFLGRVLQARDDLNLKSRFLWYHHSCPLIYYHIHKNGGGSMATHVPIEMEKFNSEKERRVGGGAYETLCYTYLQQVYESQNRRNDGQQEKQIHMFAFLRDPLDRFLSSLGQVLMGQKALLRKRLEPCHNSLTTADLIACVLHKMESTSSFLDEHFAPQSYELYIGMLGLNLSIDVMDLSLLSQVVVQLGGSRDHVHENSAVGTIDNYPQYRLTPASLTREFQERICQLYEADVLMIEQTGVTTTRCTDLTSTRE